MYKELYKNISNYCFSTSLALWTVPGAMLITSLVNKDKSLNFNLTSTEVIVLIMVVVLALFFFILGVMLTPLEDKDN